MATHRVRAEPLPAHSSDVARSKRDLTSWWKNFKRGDRKREDEKEPLPAEVGIFGVPLQTSIRYANVAISLYDSEGRSYIYGYVPIVVAKCGVFLKEKATDVEGIFRLSGSEKRIKELRNTFNSPDRYGKGLDWTGYTVHDAANILRRYFNQLPEPIIPLDFYDRFRDPLRDHQAQAVGDIDGQSPSVGSFDLDEAIRRYQQLITELPPLNRQLLLYILDLLAVFASKSDLNKMTTPNLAAIFQPGILSHPQHDMSPSEYRLSQDVLIFLIEKQDHFLIGMQGTAADEKTVQEVESGPPTPSAKPSTPRLSKTGLLHRSTSSSSVGADSVRRFGGLRRNVSTSSRQSRTSNVGHSPVSPSFGTSTPPSGVHRSNTVPTKKSPAIPSAVFGKDPASPSPASKLAVKPHSSPHPSQDIPPALAAAAPTVAPAAAPTHQPSAHTRTFTEDTDSTPAPAVQAPLLEIPSAAAAQASSKEPQQPSLPQSSPTSTEPSSTFQATAKTISAMFKPSAPDPSGRRPNKLQKRRVASGSANPSTNSSTHSLTNPDAAAVASADTADPPPTAQTILDRDTLHPSDVETTPARTRAGANLTISPTTSFRSHSTMTDHDDGASEDLAGPGPSGESEEKRKRRWHPFKSDKDKEENRSKLSPSPSATGSDSLQPRSSQSQLQPQHQQAGYGGNTAAQRSRTSVHSNSTPTQPSPLTQPPAGVPAVAAVPVPIAATAAPAPEASDQAAAATAHPAEQSTPAVEPSVSAPEPSVQVTEPTAPAAEPTAPAAEPSAPDASATAPEPSTPAATMPSAGHASVSPPDLTTPSEPAQPDPAPPPVTAATITPATTATTPEPTAAASTTNAATNLTPALPSAPSTTDPVSPNPSTALEPLPHAGTAQAPVVAAAATSATSLDAPAVPASSSERRRSKETERSSSRDERDKRGPIEWMRGKLAEHKERAADRARAKSPEGKSVGSRSSGEHEGGMRSLGGVVEGAEKEREKAEKCETEA